jgi:hypothetical protein
MTEETLFHEALARPATERAADILKAVEALLAAHDASAELLNQTHANPAGCQCRWRASPWP